MDTDSFASSRHSSVRPDQLFLGGLGTSTASTPRTSVAGSSVHASSDVGTNASLCVPAEPPPPLTEPLSLSRSPHQRKRRAVAGADLVSPGRTARILDPSSGRGPTAHDISKSAQSALQLLQARSDLQAQQQREARRRIHSREEAHTRLTAGPGGVHPTTTDKGKCPTHRAQDPAEVFLARKSPGSSRMWLASDSHRSSRASVESPGPSVVSARPPSIRSNRSNRSNRSSRSSFHSALSGNDLPGGSQVDFIDTIPEGVRPPDTVPASPDFGRGRSTISGLTDSPPDFLSYLWDMPTEETYQASSNSLNPYDLQLGSRYFLPLPQRSRTRSTASAPGSRRSSLKEERPVRPCTTRQSSPIRQSAATSDGLGLSDLTSLRALDMGHRQLSHASSLARTLTRPLSAPIIKPILQFWLAASLSTFTLIWLSTLMVCSYFLTMYDDATHRTRIATSAAAKAHSKGPSVYGPMRRFAWFCMAPLRKLFIAPGRPAKPDPSQSDSDDVGGPDQDDPFRPPGPRPPLGPLLASVALTLTVAMGTGLFRLAFTIKRHFANAANKEAQGDPYYPEQTAYTPNSRDKRTSRTTASRSTRRSRMAVR